ncbi:MAG: GntR family transcriptional regulator [Nocardioidaceae bacterium]
MNDTIVNVYERLREQILTGEFTEGTWLREGTLATALGTSRTPVRDALRRLHGDGLVKLTPNRGAQVTGIALSNIEDIFELRSLLEGFAARKAAESGAADAAHLTALCDAMEVAATSRIDAGDEITRLNLQFHSAVHEASGSALLPRLLEGVIAISLVRHTFHHYDEQETARSFAQHRELVRAITARDGAWAEAVMVAHIRAARRTVDRVRTATEEDQNR